jgi:hypothetical protein
MRISPMVHEWLHTDKQTVMTKVIVAFRNFANTPKMVLHLKHINI